jgi:gas vesicle protein
MSGVEKPNFIRKLEESGEKEIAMFLFRFYNTLCQHEGDFPFLQDDSVKEGLTRLMLETFEKSPDGELTAKKLMSLPLAELQEYVAATVRQALRAFEEKMERRMEEKIEQAKEELKEHIDDRGIKVAKKLGHLIAQGANSTMEVVSSHSEAIKQEIRSAVEEIKRDNAERAYIHERSF